LTKTINYSTASRPFIIASIILLFIGSFIGSIWLMSIFGINLPSWLHGTLQLHKMLQVDGFLTLLIMGIGYMIIPRFRNVQLVSVKLVYVSFILILVSLSLQVIQSVRSDKDLSTEIMISRLVGILIFLILLFWTLRIRPKLLRLSDYFIALCLITLITVNLIDLSRNGYSNSLTQVLLWLLFPTLMIFGIEYKTLPSFLGYIRPRKTLALISFILISICIISGLASLIFLNTLLLSMVFSFTFFASVLIFAIAIYAFGGFDNSEILLLISGEKKARYNFIVVHIRLSFMLLLLGITIALLFFLVGPYYIFYDLAIHIIAIGFIGLTIALYLPLMLPPIIGKIVHFTNLNKIPLILIVISLCMRAAGGLFLGQPLSSSSEYVLNLHRILSYFFGLSGWLVVAAMFIFVIMIQRSMRNESNIM
jgi:hypothetical protein